MYPAPYEKTLWFHKKANPKLIRRAINEFDWIRALSNVSTAKKVCYFTETLLNIIHNFIPHERIVCDDRDPPWMNGEIKNLINEKNLAYKSYCRFNRDVFLFEKFKFLQNQLNVSIENSKQTYYSKLSIKLANPATSTKTCRSIVQTFLNNKKNSCILSLFHKNKFITNFKEKAELFHTFFANQYTLLNNSSVVHNNLAKITNESLDTINFSADDFLK